MTFKPPAYFTGATLAASITMAMLIACVAFASPASAQQCGDVFEEEPRGETSADEPSRYVQSLIEALQPQGAGFRALGESTHFVAIRRGASPSGNSYLWVNAQGQLRGELNQAGQVVALNDEVELSGSGPTRSLPDLLREASDWSLVNDHTVFLRLGDGSDFRVLDLAARRYGPVHNFAPPSTKRIFDSMLLTDEHESEIFYLDPELMTLFRTDWRSGARMGVAITGNILPEVLITMRGLRVDSESQQITGASASDAHMLRLDLHSGEAARFRIQLPDAVEVARHGVLDTDRIFLVGDHATHNGNHRRVLTVDRRSGSSHGMLLLEHESPGFGTSHYQTALLADGRLMLAASRDSENGARLIEVDTGRVLAGGLLSSATVRRVLVMRDRIYFESNDELWSLPYPTRDWIISPGP